MLKINGSREHYGVGCSFLVTAIRFQVRPSRSMALSNVASFRVQLCRVRWYSCGPSSLICLYHGSIRGFDDVKKKCLHCFALWIPVRKLQIPAEFGIRPSCDFFKKCVGVDLANLQRVIAPRKAAKIITVIFTRGIDRHPDNPLPSLLFRPEV